MSNKTRMDSIANNGIAFVENKSKNIAKHDKEEDIVHQRERKKNTFKSKYRFGKSVKPDNCVFFRYFFRYKYFCLPFELLSRM